MRALIAAMRFLTRIPLPGPATRPEDLPRAVGWFPVVGGLVGFATAGAFVLAMRVWSPAVAAVLAIGCGLLLTGAFHEDGFADSMDGLGGGRSKTRVLQIMKDSRIGTYGSAGLWWLLMLRWAVLCELGDRSLWAFPLAMVWGRWSAVATLRLLPSASRGLAHDLFRPAGPWPLALASGWVVAAQGLAWYFGVPRLERLVVLSVVAAATWILYLRRRLGGHTGDLLGAGNQLVETAALLALLS